MQHVARRADDLPARSVLVANPDEDCSPGAFRMLLDELAAGPVPVMECLDAGDLLADLRADAERE